MLPAQINDALEQQFALRYRHPEREGIYDGYRSRSEAFRHAATARLGIRYAAGPRCLLDVFPALPGAPVFLFIHGGYWRALDRSDFSFMAEPYQMAGVTVVMPSYDLAPAVGVGDILVQMREVLAWTVRELVPCRIMVGGHSAGGQLAAMLAVEQALGGGDGPICGVAGISGAYDLTLLLHTSINADVGLSREAAEALSPLHRLSALPIAAKLPPLLAVVGGEETDGFKNWTYNLHTAWRDCGGSSTLLELPSLTHFTVLGPLADPTADVTRRTLGLVC